MTERGTQARLVEMETRMNQMTYMIAKREAFQTNQTVAMMVEENTQARLTKIEIRLDQMTSMLVEIRNLVMASPVDTQATPLIDLASSKREFGEYSKDQCSPRRNWRSTNEMILVPEPSTCFTKKSKSSDQAWGLPKAQEPKKKRHMVAKEVPRDSPPRFSGFDESKTCIYHMGENGHDVDDCLVLKNKVQNLIDKRLLIFKEAEPNIHQNPLLEHQRVNMIDDYGSNDDYEAWKEHRRRVDHRFVEEALTNGEIIAPLGEDNGGYRFMVKLTPPAWSRDPNLIVTPDRWGGLDDLEESEAGASNEVPTPETGLEAKFEAKPPKEIAQEENNEYESGTEEVEEDLSTLFR